MECIYVNSFTCAIYRLVDVINSYTTSKVNHSVTKTDIKDFH